MGDVPKATQAEVEQRSYGLNESKKRGSKPGPLSLTTLFHETDACQPKNHRGIMGNKHRLPAAQDIAALLYHRQIIKRSIQATRVKSL